MLYNGGSSACRTRTGDRAQGTLGDGRVESRGDGGVGRCSVVLSFACSWGPEGMGGVGAEGESGLRVRAAVLQMCHVTSVNGPVTSVMPNASRVRASVLQMCATLC